MARYLYRVLRWFNMMGSIEERALRGAMVDNAKKRALQDRIAADLSRPLSYVLPMTGIAMKPAINAAVDDPHAAHDRLVIRRLNGGGQAFLNRIYKGDVVVVRDPADNRRRYVRRIAALEGAQLVSDRPGDEPFAVPAEHAWVVRDNDAANEAPDSRFFGPLNVEHIVGRVMYAIRSATDHGRITSSPYAMAADAIVLAHEPVAMHFKDDDKGTQRR